jgi:ferrous iron transport protein B
VRENDGLTEEAAADGGEARACEEPASSGPSAPGPVIILGSANTGKSTLFHRLTGGRSCTAEVPGVGAGLPRGTAHLCGRARGLRAALSIGPEAAGEGHRCPDIYDTPGTATLFPQGEDEAAARDAVLRLGSGVLLVVADAKNVRRSLALTLHAAELGLPMVLAVNMADEASRRGIGVDTARLARRLGVDVVATVATEGKGIEELRRGLAAAHVPRRVLTFPEPIASELERIEAALSAGPVTLPCSTHGLALQLLGGDEVAADIVRARLGEGAAREVRAVVDEARRGLRRPTAVAITDRIYEVADQLASEVVKVSRAEHGGWGRAALDRIGLWAEHPLLGSIIAACVVAVMYLWVGVLGATVVVDALDHALFSGLLVPFGQRLVAPIPSAFVRDALMDPQFGMLPTGLFLAFGIVLPVLFFFFFAFGVLQSSGYLPRLSVLFDRIFRHVGLNGTGVMPLVMGFSCVTMALITTRMLATRRERIIASFLLLGLPCAPLLAVMLAVLARMPLSATLVVLGVLTLQKVVAGVVAARTLPGLAPDFIMVIPPLRLPHLGHVLEQTVRQTYAFMKEAVPLFLVASFLLFIFDRVGGLDALEWLAHPVIHGLLQLPDEAVQVLVKAMIRRESGAAELAHVRDHFTNLQLVVMLLVLATIVPCVNAAIVLVKERGLRASSLIVLAVMGFALAVGGAVSHLCTLLGVTFTSGG